MLLRPAESAACVCVVICVYVHARIVLLHISFIKTVCGIHSIYQQLNNELNCGLPESPNFPCNSEWEATKMHWQMEREAATSS